MSLELWEHQRKAIQHAQDKANYALLFDPGTGKSATIINILRQKFAAQNQIFRTLILCPTVVCENWKNEWLKFSKVPEEQILVLLGPGKDRAHKISTTRANIIVTNYQALIMDQVYDAIRFWGPWAVVADESHRIKTPGAKTTKRAIEIADKAKYRYILTGTPILKSLMDFYSQFKFLDSGETFGKSFNFFKNFYFYNANANAPSHVTWPDWKIRPNAEKEIQAKVFKKAMYVEKSKCLDLPPLVRKKISIEMSPEQRRHYTQMEKEFVTYIGDKAATASIALTKGLRLMQIVSGFVKTEDGSTIRFKDNPRADALSELLEDIAPHHKVIVWACFKENYEMVKECCARLALPFGELHGETKNRAEVIEAFQNDPDIRVLIGNQGAGGIGVNLTTASYSIYFSRNFSLEHDLQSEARNYRGGSEVHAKITRIDLVSKETIDEHVLEALALKQNVSDSVLKDIARRL